MDSTPNRPCCDPSFPRPRAMPTPPNRAPRRTPQPPPPVPLRRSQPNYTPMFRTPYSGYGSGMFSSMYNYNAPYSSPYNRHPLSNFVRLAEDSSRPAFESMENIVQAFGSIAMVLESTYFAVQSSFRAVLGLAEHFSRLRVQMTQMISAFTLFRTLRYIYRKLLVWMRLRSAEVSEADDVWTELANADGLFSDKSGRRRSSWPLLLFLCIVIGGPYLIWRLMASMNDSVDADWMTGDGEHFVGVAEYDYDAENEDEISISAGQEIKMAPKDMQPRIRGWLLACADGEKSGLVPANYVRVRGKRQGRRTARSQAGAARSSVTTARSADDACAAETHGRAWREVDGDARRGDVRFKDEILDSESSSANESEVCSSLPSADSAIGSDHKEDVTPT